MKTGPININTNNPRKLPKDNIPKAYRDVAKAMEKQFANFMVEQMKKTVSKSNPDNTATKYYDSLMNDEYAKTLTDTKGGLGIQDMVLDQIYPQHLRQNAYSNIKAYRDLSNVEVTNAGE